MTTERSYTCNLCRGRIAPTGQPERGMAGGNGVVFGGSHVPDQPIFKFTIVQSAENHLCESCISCIRRLG